MSTAVQDAFDQGREAMRSVAGESVVYTPVGGVASDLDLVAFIEDFEITDPNDINIVSTEPVAQIATGDVSNPKNGDTLVRNGVTYYVRYPKDDGLGVTLLVLSRKTPL